LEGTYLNGKWKLEARLGSGGVATVWRATHRNGTRVAIKMLDEGPAEDEDVRRRFLREGYVANSVGHPGAVRVLDDNVTEDGRVFLVMELLEGEALDIRCKRLGGKLPLEEAVDVADGILDVLAAAHDKGIVHRDIKPANVFLTTTGVVKVLDFGLAKMKSTIQADSTAVGALLGTPGYMAPEVARAARDDDARADVWSVGATMFKLLTGQHAFEASDMLALLVATTRDRPRSLAKVATEIPPALADVVDRALAVQPTERWPNARAMQAALRAARDAPERRRVFASVHDFADEHDATVMSSPETPLRAAPDTAQTGKHDAYADEDEATVLSERAVGAMHDADAVPKMSPEPPEPGDTSGFTAVMRDAPVRFTPPGGTPHLRAPSSAGHRPPLVSQPGHGPPSGPHAQRSPAVRLPYPSTSASRPAGGPPAAAPPPRPPVTSAAKSSFMSSRPAQIAVLAVGVLAGIILIVLLVRG
jgi:serine/threonine-protein kinase